MLSSIIFFIYPLKIVFVMAKGKFITFEGIEGSGKSTQLGRIYQALISRNHTILRTREPGGTPTGETIRSILQHEASGEALDPRTEVLLFAASRAQLVSRFIKPNLEKGYHTLCDRFIDSSIAYQGYARGFSPKEIEKISLFATEGFLPDLTLLLDLNVEKGLKRLEKRRTANGEVQQKDRIEREEKPFHERTRKGYLELAREYPQRIVVIDADRDEDKIYDCINSVLRERLGL